MRGWIKDIIQLERCLPLKETRRSKEENNFKNFFRNPISLVPIPRGIVKAKIFQELEERHWIKYVVRFRIRKMIRILIINLIVKNNVKWYFLSAGYYIPIKIFLNCQLSSSGRFCSFWICLSVIKIPLRRFLCQWYGLSCHVKWSSFIFTLFKPSHQCLWSSPIFPGTCELGVFCNCYAPVVHLSFVKLSHPHFQSWL